jgi:Right handed beta helix region
VIKSQNVIVRDNTIACSDCVSPISFYGGSNNQLLRNKIDGGYHGNSLTGHGGDGPGADDGVILVDESNDLVQSNRISNVYDAGVEGVNAVTNTTIADNQITNAIEAGISSYHCTTWEGNAIRNNTVITSQYLVEFYYFGADDKCYQPAPTSGSFRNNQIVSNSIQAVLGPSIFNAFFNFGVVATSTVNNLIQDNDFGNRGLTTNPASGFTIAGNSCGSGGNVKCNSLGVQIGLQTAGVVPAARPHRHGTQPEPDCPCPMWSILPLGFT